MTADSAHTDPYTVLWENEHVRVLAYSAAPGVRSERDEHPNRVVVALTDVQQALTDDGDETEFALSAGEAAWLPAQWHAAENIGGGTARAIIVELKGDAAGYADDGMLGAAEVAPFEPTVQTVAADSDFAMSDARLREIFGDAIVDADVHLSAEDPEASRWDDEVSYTSPMSRYLGRVAYASVGVNVATGRWSFVCDTDESGACIHTYSLVLEALEDPEFGRYLQAP